VGTPRIELPTWLRGLPVLSVGLAALWLLVGLAVEVGYSARAERGALEMRGAVQYALDHPAVKVPPRLLPPIRALMPGFESNEMFAFLRKTPASGPNPQEEFDVMVARAFASVDAHPHRSLGVVPAHLVPRTFASYWLLHSGTPHLLATLALWLLLAPVLERLWGRPVFGGLLLATTLLAAGVYTLVHPRSDCALVGGSALLAFSAAAIAVRFRSEDLDLLGWLPGPARLELSAPAWGVVLIWVAYEAGLHWLVRGAQPPGLDNAVGYSAHAAAALLGGLAPRAMERLGWEQRFGAPPVATRAGAAERFDFQKILTLRARGESERAFDLLENELRRSARNRDAVTTFWQMCIERGEPERAASAMRQLVGEELRRGADEVAVAQWRELAEHLPALRLPPPLLFRLAPVVRRVDGDESAVIVIQQLLDADDAVLESAGLARAARLAEDLAPALAVQAARRALATGRLADGPRVELEQLLERRAPALEDGGDPLPEKPEPGPAPPPNVFYEQSDRSAFGEIDDLGSLDQSFPDGALFDAVPRRIEADGIHLEVAGAGEMGLAFPRLRGVSVAGVHGLGPKPVVLIDLLVDGAGSEQPLRVLRLRSDRFSPRRLFPEAGGSLDALRRLVQLVLSRCDARPLPDAEGAAARPVRVYDSVDEYHAAVIRPAAQEWL
jgi:membrane associated rhomboid family serine protease